MLKLVLVSCLLALALAYPNHKPAESTQKDAEVIKPAIPAESAEVEKPAEEEVKKPAEKKEKPAVDVAESPKEDDKVAEPAIAEPKPEADAPKKEVVPAPPAEAHHADAKAPKS